MGRGRQKAKQRKVARTLKYSTPETDYRALERELVSRDHLDEVDDDDPYADYEDYYPESDDEDDDYEDEDDAR